MPRLRESGLGNDARSSKHGLCAAQSAQYGFQVGLVPHGDHEAQVGRVECTLVIHIHVGDIGFRVGQFCGHACENPFAVAYGDHYPGFEQARVHPTSPLR